MYMYILAGEGGRGIYNICIYIYLHMLSVINNSRGWGGGEG